MKKTVQKKKSVPTGSKQAGSKQASRVKTPVKAPIKAPMKTPVKTQGKTSAGSKQVSRVKAPVGTKKGKESLAKLTRVSSAQPVLPQSPKVPGPHEEIRKMLLRQKQSLLAEAGVLLENTLNPTNEIFPDWTDQASVETDQNFILRLREREQQLLRKIEDALERIEGETFGICEACGGQISIKRLKARPVTTLCIECKTRQELEEKMRQD